MTDYQRTMAEFAAGLKYEDLPEHVVARAREVVADTMVVIAAGAREEEVQKLTARLAPDTDGPADRSMLLGEGRRTNAMLAALINGAAGTFLELDEGNQFARGHPAIHVLPAALAVAEDGKMSGRDLILALVLGYEIGSRIGIAARIRMSMHPHGTWGATGAAVAVGKLMGYGPDDFRRLINISSSLALATSRKTMLEGGTVRNIYSGVGNHMGILAHQLAASGFTGEADGLGTVYGSVISETFDREAMTLELGERWEIARNYFKRHACCRYNHSTLDALEKIAATLPEGRIPVAEVDRVDVHTYSLAAQLSDQNPQNMLAAKFSIPFAVATYLIHCATDIDCFRPDKAADPSILELARRVTVTEDPALTAMMPDKRPSRVTVFMTDGRVLTAETFVNRGDFEDPYSADDLRDKYMSLGVPVWGGEAAEQVFDRAHRLESLDDVNLLTAPLARS